MAKKQISAKQVGKNIIVIIGEEKHSKAIETKEERTVILEQVESYNKKNDAKLLKKITDALAPAIKSTSKSKTTEPKKVEVKKEVKEKVNKVKEAPKPVVPYSRRRGEY